MRAFRYASDHDGNAGIRRRSQGRRRSGFGRYR
jgi:hypothetical protein